MKICVVLETAPETTIHGRYGRIAVAPLQYMGGATKAPGTWKEASTAEIYANLPFVLFQASPASTFPTIIPPTVLYIYSRKTRSTFHFSRRPPRISQPVRCSWSLRPAACVPFVIRRDQGASPETCSVKMIATAAVDLSPSRSKRY